MKVERRALSDNSVSGASETKYLTSANGFDSLNGAQLFDELIEHDGVFYHNGEYAREEAVVRGVDADGA